jgi:muramoyltetrapeptide carboxypeptidase
MTSSTQLTLFTPAGVVAKAAPLRLAVKRLTAMGYRVQVDEAALLKDMRFGGDDDTRLAALHRVASQAPSIAMATRGGYGLTRLLDRIDWKLLAKSVGHGTRWVGYSDMTALQLGLLAHAKATSWAGPLAVSDFGADEMDEITPDCFAEAMSGELEAVGFRTEAGFDGLEVKGTLWGGNLCVLNSMLGTRHWPKVRGGVLFLEDANEHPYRIERNLLQLHQAGVLDAQKAVVLGAFTGYRKSPLDRGYSMKTVVAHLRSLTRTPILTGMPFGHVPTKLTVPVGEKVTLVVAGRDVLMGWRAQHDHVGDRRYYSH